MEIIIQAVAILGSLCAFVAWQVIRGLKARNTILEYKQNQQRIENDFKAKKQEILDSDLQSLVDKSNERFGSNSETDNNKKE
ncbi:hypothetical protein UFOVP610_15 [uncultured Caudovirales phage]|uniref:Uncharacterized protein n=1 Tax=uncultured Caudovirales phage TaxID=2100421 RepID=A0A6J5N3C8_9CAUD|nr:hypothetical protein UFOVP610_15 [uncultured Caudovirales phage]